MAEASFHVVTDGGCDLPESMEMDPARAPLGLAFGEELYRSDELSPREFYGKLKSSRHHPRTSQPSPEQFTRIYGRLKDKPILSMHISAGLSGTLNAARQGAEQVDGADVSLYDTKTLSIAQAFQVYAAQQAATLGKTLETAREWAQRVGSQTHMLFTIDTLEYLQRGGRIGRVQAMMGSLLNLKPLVYVDRDSGTYVGVGRARTFPKAVSALLKKAEEYVPARGPVRLAVAYGDNEPEADALIERARKTFDVHWAGKTPVGPVLAVHTGPRALGMCIASGRWPWEEESAD